MFLWVKTYIKEKSDMKAQLFFLAINKVIYYMDYINLETVIWLSNFPHEQKKSQHVSKQDIKVCKSNIDLNISYQILQRINCLSYAIHIHFKAH